MSSSFNSERYAMQTLIRRMGSFLMTAAVSAFLSHVAWAQQSKDYAGNPEQGQSGASNTELTIRNLNRVAASATQVRAVLVSNPGLVVELKRWVAEDAASHGQVVQDGDLTDDAIFDRLANDVKFRSIATVLLQKYGYLVPDVNPNSEEGKERALLIQERTKWLAQAQEEARVQARQKEAEDFKKASACESQQDPKCTGATQPSSAPAQTVAPGRQYQQQIPFGYPQNDQTSPSIPLIPGTTLERTQLIQTGTSPTDNYSPFGQYSLLNTGAGNSPASGTNMNSLTGLTGFGFGSSSGSSEPAQNRQLAAALSSMNSGMGGPTDGLLGSYGMGMGGVSGVGMGMQDFSGMLMGGGSSNNFLPGPTGTALVPMQPYRKFPTTEFAEPSEMIRTRNPYQDVPSLYDMFVQTVARPSTPQRFGMEVFENGAHDLQLIPMDLPAGPDYVVGPGDGLSIDLWGGGFTAAHTHRGSRRPDQPAGSWPTTRQRKILAEVQQDVQQELRTQFRDVSAGVSLARLRTIRVYEVGDVTNPGAYDISSLSTPLNALFVAAGPSTRGSLRLLKHYRGNQLIQTVDVYDLLLHGVKTNIERLENGDTVQVPPIGPQVTIEGMVRRPAIYELRDEKNLADVIELAGGLLPAASLRHIEVQRLVAHEKQTMLSVDIPDGAAQAEVTKTLESFQIQDGDRVRIYPIAPYNQDTIFLEGHVLRPGRYSYRAGMHVTDVISSYKDMLPEPALQYAEIIRLNPPDYRPSVESFNLTEALADPAKAPVLQSDGYRSCVQPI